MKIFIAIPSTDYIHKNFIQCLFALEKEHPTKIVLSESSLVHVTRNRLIEEALRTDCTHILWLDSDMIFEPNFLNRMIESLGDKDFISALYFNRRPPFTPCIFKDLKVHIDRPVEVEKFSKENPYPKNEIFEIGASGFGGILMTTKLASAVFDRTKGFPFSLINGGLVGEDISFCAMAKLCGFKLYCDSSIKMGHITQTIVDEKSYELVGE